MVLMHILYGLRNQDATACVLWMVSYCLSFQEFKGIWTKLLCKGSPVLGALLKDIRGLFGLVYLTVLLCHNGQRQLPSLHYTLFRGCVDKAWKKKNFYFIYNEFNMDKYMIFLELLLVLRRIGMYYLPTKLLIWSPKYPKNLSNYSIV